jgi:glutathione synthase/RimK-type ligase-like ATP-grasp enzyme
LDTLLRSLAAKGIFVSADPEVIRKIGTKKVLYTTRHMDWGGDTDAYTDFNDFTRRFLSSVEERKVRILKQYRGNGGNGVFKVWFADTAKKLVSVVHALKAGEERILSQEDFHNEFKKYFDNDGILINQNWVSKITNGMVRCYLTGSKVSGFGYQESNALCPQSDGPDSNVRPTSKRYYYSEHCGLFRDLRNIMESKWVPELQKIHEIEDNLMSVGC